MKLDKLTADQEQLMHKVRDQWIQRALYGGDELDLEAARTGIEWMYDMCGMKAPKVILVDSPLGVQYAANILLIEGMGNRDQVSGQVRGQVSDQVSDQVYGQVRDQVYGQVRGQVRGQVSDQVSDQVRGQVYDQVSGQVYGQVSDQVRGQVYDQVSGQVYGQVYDQVSGQVYGQVYGQVSGQVRGQVYGQVRGQVYDQVYGQVYGQVSDQVSDQVRGQVYGQVRDQVRGQVSDQVYGQVRDQVRGQVSDQVYGQVYGQVSGQVRGQVYGQVRGQVYDQVRGQVYGQVRDQKLTYFQWAWENLAWRTEYSFYDFFAQIGVAKHEGLKKYLDYLNSGVFFCVFLNDFAIICRRPNFVARDAEHNLHNDHRSAISWRDGYELFYLQGEAFDKELWQKISDKTITAKEVMQIEDVDKRTIAISMLSPEEMIKQLKMKLIDTGVEGTKLYECKNFMGTRKTEYALRMTDWSTPREFIEFTPPEIGKLGDAVLCQAKAFGITRDEYLAIKERG